MTCITSRSALFLSLVLVGCGVGQAPREDAPAVKRSALEASFDRAAAEYQVPVAVLKSIAYVETRALHSPDRSLQGGYGVMQLIQREDWNTLSRAAQLTGVDEAKLKVDPDANIRGGAAVLRELADKSFHDYPALDPNDPADFFHAVSLYNGLSSAMLAQDYAADVYRTAEAGFVVDGPTGRIEQQAYGTDFRKNLLPVGSRSDALKEYPNAYQWLASPNYSSGRSDYNYVIIHTTQGDYSGTLSWFKSTTSQVSAHYVVRSSDGQITQMVEEANTAWHAQCYNSHAIGVEHEGFINDPTKWYTDAMYTASAALTRWSADRHNIPKTRSHFIGHAEVPPSCNTNNHTDPGTGWNWTKYMALVNSGSTGSTGTVTGAIYQNGDQANRVSGAVVTVSGKTQTTGADGMYTFQLAPGVYTVNVTKTGYGSASVSLTVTAGATVWGTMEINPAGTGTLTGKVFVYNPASPSDMSQAINGATVKVSTQTVTTGTDGMWQFTLPAGTYTATVTAPGYQQNTVTRTVLASGTVWGSVGLHASGADSQPPALAISFPSDNASLDIAMVTVSGTADDDSGPLATVKLSVNGGQPTDVAVTAGQFSQQVKLAAGANTVTVSATDPSGNTGTATVHATFNAGISGFVYQSGDESIRIPDATVTLIDPTTGTTAATATTGSDGHFSLTVSKAGMDYRLIIRAAGFISDAETITVADDARLSVQLPLTPGEDRSGGPLQIEFMQPQEGARVGTETLTIYGNVAGVQVTSVMVNGVGADLFDGGGFTATIPLSMGDNAIDVTARGIHDEVVSGTLHVTRVDPSELSHDPTTTPATGRTHCAAVPGDLALPALLVLPALRRIRRRRSL